VYVSSRRKALRQASSQSNYDLLKLASRPAPLSVASEEVKYVLDGELVALGHVASFERGGRERGFLALEGEDASGPASVKCGRKEGRENAHRSSTVLSIVIL
jgi:hypothetical protein